MERSSFLDSDTAGNRFTAVVVGAIGCVLFGAGGAFFVWKKLREPAVLTLTPAGIRVQSAGFIPWANLDAVGVGRTPGGPYGAKIIGIRVKSQKQLVETMSPQEQRLMRGAARVGRAAGFALQAGRHPGQKALRSVPRQDPVAIMEWTRSTTGWDLSWSPMLFNHRSTTVVEMIETYHRSVRRSSSPDTFPPHR